MKDSYLYTIVFTFVLTAVFATILAMTQAAYLPAITENEENVHRAAILKVLDLDLELDLYTTFNEQVVPVAVSNLAVYAVNDADGEPISFAFPFTGQGLWGSLRGYIGVTANFEQLLGLEFVENNETPGLGGRIDEPWFKDQFQGTPLIPGEKLVYGAGLDAITGATSSSQAVLGILNDTIAELMTLKEVMGR